MQTDTTYAVTGNTYDVRHILKGKLLCRWNATMQRWEATQNAVDNFNSERSNLGLNAYNRRDLAKAGITFTPITSADSEAPATISTRRERPACYYCGCPSVGFSMGEPACENCGG